MLGGTSGADAWASEASAGSRLTGAVPASGMAGVGASARSGAGVASPLGWVAVASAATGSLAVGSARGVSAGSARTGSDTTGSDTTGLDTAGSDTTGWGRKRRSEKHTYELPALMRTSYAHLFLK